jgi:hypothetical protein
MIRLIRWVCSTLRNSAMMADRTANSRAKKSMMASDVSRDAADSRAG